VVVVYEVNTVVVMVVVTGLPCSVQSRLAGGQIQPTPLPPFIFA
jgi:hypothetical protein